MGHVRTIIARPALIHIIKIQGVRRIKSTRLNVFFLTSIGEGRRRQRRRRRRRQVGSTPTKKRKKQGMCQYFWKTRNKTKNHQTSTKFFHCSSPKLSSQHRDGRTTHLLGGGADKCHFPTTPVRYPYWCCKTAAKLFVRQSWGSSTLSMSSNFVVGMITFRRGSSSSSSSSSARRNCWARNRPYEEREG